jgi:hypothetical protein
MRSFTYYATLLLTQLLFVTFAPLSHSQNPPAEITIAVPSDSTEFSNAASITVFIPGGQSSIEIRARYDTDGLYNFRREETYLKGDLIAKCGWYRRNWACSDTDGWMTSYWLTEGTHRFYLEAWLYNLIGQEWPEYKVWTDVIV